MIRGSTLAGTLFVVGLLVAAGCTQESGPTIATRPATPVAQTPAAQTPTEGAPTGETSTPSAPPTSLPLGPPPTPSPTPSDRTVHVVAEGETFVVIADLYGVTVQDILDLNPDLDPENLLIGDEVIVPGPPASTDSG